MGCFFFAQFSFADIIKDEKYITGESSFPLKEVCKKLVKRESPLIDIASITELNCMGKKVDVGAFCDEKEAGNPYYIRAFIDKESKQVKCLSSKRVIIQYKCEGPKDKFCEDQETGCFLLKEKLAKRLQIVHQSLGDDKILKCYFDLRVNMNFPNE